MKTLVKLSRELKSDLLPLNTIKSALNNYSIDARKSYLKRACQKGDLIRLQNGLYLLGEEYRMKTYHPFEIANLMQEPSYISLESALSYYGLIPEAVYSTTSVTTNPKREQDTPLGHFSFSYLKTGYFNFGFYQVSEDNYRYLIATPLKALMDTVVLRKKFYRSLQELEDDLRFNVDEFKTYRHFVSRRKIDEMLEVYKSYRLQIILKELRKKL